MVYRKQMTLNAKILWELMYMPHENLKKLVFTPFRESDEGFVVRAFSG